MDLGCKNYLAYAVKDLLFAAAVTVHLTLATLVTLRQYNSWGVGQNVTFLIVKIMGSGKTEIPILNHKYCKYSGALWNK